jgi:hypothetical protein
MMKHLKQAEIVNELMCTTLQDEPILRRAWKYFRSGKYQPILPYLIQEHFAVTVSFFSIYSY